MGATALLHVLCGCGRIGFAPLDAVEDAGDGVLADFSGVVPFNANDFLDTAFVGNEAKTVASLTSPFPDGFAIGAGRNVIEIRLDQQIILHDLRPAAADLMGPDEIDQLTFGQGVLWMASATPNGGDGLYTLDAGWTLARDNTLNNIFASAWDETGVFEARGVSALYFTQGTAAVYRRDSSTMRTSLFVPPANLGTISITEGALYTVYGEPPIRNLVRIEATTHMATTFDSAGDFEIAEGGPSDGVVAIRDERDLLVYAPDGTSTLVASTPDPDTRWTAATVPRAPHPLAERIIVVEVNRVLDRDRLLLIP